MRQTIVEAFAGDDYGVEGNDTDSDAGLEFLGESNFSFVFQIMEVNQGRIQELLIGRARGGNRSGKSPQQASPTCLW